MKYILQATALLFGFSTFAQDESDFYRVENQDWANVKEVFIADHIKENDEAIARWNYALEFRYDDDNGFYLYKLNHKQIWIGSNEAIENNNKIYLPTSNAVEVIELKARAILPDGAVTLLDDDDVNEGVDEDDNKYNYFALEGLTKGSVVEYYFITKEYPSIKGNKLAFQTDIPIYNLAYDLVSPGNLYFESKSYNGIQQAEQDTVLEYQNRLFVRQDTLPELKVQPMSNRSANRGSVVYKLDVNTYSGDKDISSFAYACERIYSNVNVERKKSIDKKLRTLLKYSGLEQGETEREKIIFLENYIKENYFNVQKGGDDYSTVEGILKTKAMSEIGTFRLYDGLLDVAGISYNMVFTCDKSNWRFDAEFENQLSISDGLLYFPKSDLFIDPMNIFSRGSFVDYDLLDNQGVFIDAVDIGDGFIGFGEVKNIKGHTAEESVAEQNINWTFDPETETGEINLVKKSTGYSTYNYQIISDLVPADELEEFKKNIVKSSFGEMELKNLTFENLSADKYPFEPLTIKATLPAEEFIEPSANSYVIKLGEVIGKQSELYVVDSVRTLPVAVGNPRTYRHKIVFNIPEGYILKNTDALNMTITSGEENPVMSFKSTYAINDNQLEVNIHEYYTLGELPKEQFENYRKVVNAAADFNKIYLVLELK